MSDLDRSATIAVHALVSGRVQGVYYRQSTADEARRLGLAGWVQNLADGRVELVAEGPAAAVEALVTWCRRGPPAAHVEEVRTTAREVEGHRPPFEVRRQKTPGS